MAYVSAKIFLKILMPRSLHQNFLWCQDLPKDLDSSMLSRNSIKSYKKRRLKFILCSQFVKKITEWERHIYNLLRNPTWKHVDHTEITFISIKVKDHNFPKT